MKQRQYTIVCSSAIFHYMAGKFQIRTFLCAFDAFCYGLLDTKEFATVITIPVSAKIVQTAKTLSYVNEKEMNKQCVSSIT